MQHVGQLRVGAGVVTDTAAPATPRTRFRPARRTVVVAVVVAVLVLGFVIPFVLVTSGGGHSHPKSAPAQQS